MEKRTQLLRESEEPLWQGIRRALHLRGVDPTTALLADFWRGDSALIVGYVVTPARCVFEFGYTFCSESEAAGSIAEWHDLTEVWEETEYLQAPISVALNLLDSAACKGAPS